MAEPKLRKGNSKKEIERPSPFGRLSLRTKSKSTSSAICLSASTSSSSSSSSSSIPTLLSSKSSPELLKGTTGLSSMSPEILSIIASKLKDPRDLLRLGATCKQLHEVTKQEALWRPFIRRDYAVEHSLDLKPPEMSHKSFYTQLASGLTNRWKQPDPLSHFASPSSSSSSSSSYPLSPPPFSSSPWLSLSNDSLTCEYLGSIGDKCIRTAVPYSTSLHYFEVSIESKGEFHMIVGVCGEKFVANEPLWSQKYADGWCYASSGSLWHKGKQVRNDLDPYDAGDRIGILFDFVEGRIVFYRNGRPQRPVIMDLKDNQPRYPCLDLYYQDHRASIVPCPAFPSFLPPPSSALMSSDFGLHDSYDHDPALRSFELVFPQSSHRPSLFKSFRGRVHRRLKELRR
eukprot:TRINITY_DN58_c0_g1_i1.p1 TRINITY_DN58_c0_g1~~TRINITY_DN58_c0_g1_i1.p1  ORF type:complete len:400 (-),score=139.58 TRINITY_DN58_c0_g1_i1:420-1619(-)